MDTQEKVLILRINEEFKKEFKEKCDKEHMKVATRIKYLMHKDVENKLFIK